MSSLRAPLPRLQPSLGLAGMGLLAAGPTAMAQEAPPASGGRGLSLGRIFTRDGLLVASVAQEGMLRVPR